MLVLRMITCGVRFSSWPLPRLATLRMLLGREGAQEAVRKAPFLLLHEDSRPELELGAPPVGVERSKILTCFRQAQHL